jgi:3-oxoacid CoA-transferase/3-oxoacid CoA-transferase subunit A
LTSARPAEILPGEEKAMNKTVASAAEAVRDIQDGASLLAGGFGLCGNPENCIRALREKNVRGLTIISNNCGVDDKGLGILLKNGQVKKMISSYVGENKTFERLFLSGELEVELVPQGTLAERIRAGGAGIAGFFTPTGVGTVVAEGKEAREFASLLGAQPKPIRAVRQPGGGVAWEEISQDYAEFMGRSYVLELPLRADFAIVKAWKGDPWGNLVFRKTARNFNPMMAAAGRITIAEVEELVPLGALDPDQVHTPGVYVQRIFQGSQYEKPIEQRTVRKKG